MTQLKESDMNSEDMINDNDTNDNKMETDEIASDASSLDSDDSGDDQKLLEEESALKLKIQEIQTNLQAYPYQYQLHSDLIKSFRDLGSYEELKKSREVMTDMFPLDQNLWLEWIQGEINLASSVEEYVKIISLFEKATQDYLSIPIWELFLNFLIEKYEESLSSDSENPSSITLAAIREKMTKAIHSTGYHFSESSKIWSIIHQFEEKNLENNDSEEQIKYLNELFIARLSVPHPDIEANFTLYSTFVSTHISQDLYEETMKNASSIYSNSLQFSLKLGPYEDYLKEYFFTVEAYAEYIGFLKTQLTQSNSDNKYNWIQFTKTLYERAVSQHPLQISLWEAYISFLYSDFSVNEVLVQVTFRSVRNCPWSGLLWVSHLRSLVDNEISEIEGTAISSRHTNFELATFTNALEIGMIKHNAEELVQVLMELPCVFLKKLDRTSEENKDKIRKAFRNSVSILYQAFPPGDMNWRLLRYWANIEMVQFQDLEASRKVWGEIIRKHKNYSKAWIEYIEFEIKYGSVPKARGLLKQASRTLTDYPESITIFWSDFDRIYGDIKSNLHTFSEIHGAKTRQTDKALQEAHKVAAAQTIEEAKKERAREKDRANKSRKREKRKQLNVASKDGEQPLDDKSSGKNGKSNKENDNLDDEPPRQKRKLNPKNSSRSDNDGTTLYVCNFKDTVDSDTLRSLFEKFGTIVEIRRPNNNFSFSRKFAYIQFSSQKEANDALSLDGHLLEPGFPLSVKISDPSQRHAKQASKIPEEPSPCRLFISNLPFKITQESLLLLLQPFGAVKSVRLLSSRNGTNNGCAIVEFDLEASGQAALSLNSTQIEGRIITVTIADPAARRSRTDAAPKVASTMKSKQPATNEKKKIILNRPFMPRQVRTNKP